MLERLNHAHQELSPQAKVKEQIQPMSIVIQPLSLIFAKEKFREVFNQIK